MGKSYMIGVDIGTTSTKAVLFETGGNVIAKSSEEYPLYTPTALIAEQDPDRLFSAVLDSVRQVTSESGVPAKAIRFVSFSSAMHSVIPVDKNGKPLMRCITWADNRSAAWCERLENEMNGHQIYLRTGTPIHPMSPLAKLLWMRHENKVVFEKAAKFISIKEYIFYQLFHDYVIDYSIASCTGLLNLARLDWDEEALRIAGITDEQLSRLVPTTSLLTGLDRHFAERMHIHPDTPFVVGASDGVLSNLGVNAISPGVVAVTLGTSGAIRTVVDRPMTDPKGRTFCYALADSKWVIGGPVNNGGIILRWAKDEFAAAEIETAKRLGINPYDVLTKMAERVNPGADGLIFHPYLAGERAPLWNPDARGSFFGLTLHHQKQHMIRAVLEGVIFNLYTVLLAMKEMIGEPKKIQATGGFARSPLWRQMMADIFDQPVSVPESFESSCLGAAVLGLKAIGAAESLDIVSTMVGAVHEHVPIHKNVAVYRELLPIYIRLSRKFQEEWRDIAAFQRRQFNE